MKREELLKKVEIALEKNVEILIKQSQPLESELAIKTIPVLVDLIKFLNLQA